MAHALVTGANRGLGLEFAHQLLARGERVIATCRHPGRALALTRLAGEHPGHLVILPLVLPDTRSIAELVREIATLDLRIGLLVNNAGMLVGGERFGAIEAKVLQDSFAANAAGPLLLTQALAPRLERAKVVNLSSRMGSIGGSEALQSPSYSNSKAALNMATRQLAHALAAQDAIVVAISPGWVSTDMGGSNAPSAPPDSVASMLRTIDALNGADNGRFLSADGATIPW
jgi:NAD(P)-dependent dehydrogenase (short-subunit alcohol dehydrogenase family)